MRIGTWNLYLRAQSPTELWRKKADWLEERPADIWLLTEASTAWQSRRAELIPALKRNTGPEKLRWAAVQTTLPILDLRTEGDPDHPVEEGLSLARIHFGGRSDLVACSVLPYKGAEKDWGRLSGGHRKQFRCVLDHHVARIAAEWGRVKNP